MSSSWYPGLDFGPAELSWVMRSTYDELIAFVTTPAFKAMHAELMGHAWNERPSFVTRVILSETERKKRGVQTPDGILIEVSAFGDRRPTLYVVKKFLPERFRSAWENVNLTFDNGYRDEDISRDPVMAWRPPLPVALQNAAMAAGNDLDSLPNDIGVGCEVFELKSHPRRANIARGGGS